MRNTFTLCLLLFTFHIYSQNGIVKKLELNSNTAIQELKRDSVVSQVSTFKATHDFKGKESTFVLDIVREGRKVMVYILIENLKDYKEVYVQRSDETMLGTGNCKYFTPKDFDLKKYTEVIFEDKYSLPAQRDAYYRIKCEDTNGVLRTYPWVLLPSIK